MSVCTVSAENAGNLASSNRPLEILMGALDIVNKTVEKKVVFLGQSGGQKGSPFDPRDLCELAFENGKRIGDVIAKIV